MSGRTFWDEGRQVWMWMPPSDPLVPTPLAWKAWREAHPAASPASLLCQVCGRSVSWFDVAPERTRASGFGRAQGAFEYRPGGRVKVASLVKHREMKRISEKEGRPLEIYIWLYRTITAQVQACPACQHRAMYEGGQLDVQARVLVVGAHRAPTA